MKTSTCRAIGVGLACLLGVIAAPAVAARPTVRACIAPVESDWQYPEPLEVLPSAERHSLDIETVVEPDHRNAYPETAPVVMQPTPDAATGGVRGAIRQMGLSASWNAESVTLVAPEFTIVPVSSAAMHDTSSASNDAATLFDPISQWLPQLVNEWTGGTSVAVTPWAIVATCGLILILSARLLRLRRSEPRSSTAHKRQVVAAVNGYARHPATGSTKVRKLATKTAAGGAPQEELEDWILDSLKSDESKTGLENVSRDKSEERRQLESWRKLSQTASKAFILQEEEEAAKQYAIWLSLVAVGFGVSGLGIVATSCLGTYSLLSGACLAATSLVIFGWSGLKVVFHQLRRWILLRPARS